jgi:hypothetical protein
MWQPRLTYHVEKTAVVYVAFVIDNMVCYGNEFLEKYVATLPGAHLTAASSTRERAVALRLPGEPYRIRVFAYDYFDMVVGDKADEISIWLPAGKDFCMRKELPPGELSRVMQKFLRLVSSPVCSANED